MENRKKQGRNHKISLSPPPDTGKTTEKLPKTAFSGIMYILGNFSLFSGVRLGRGMLFKVIILKNYRGSV